MVEVYVEGPDALKLISHLATNSFAKFPVNRAKQFAPCSYDGFIIGDGILFHLEENKLSYVGRAPSANWIEFHAKTGGYNVTTTKDDRVGPQHARKFAAKLAAMGVPYLFYEVIEGGHGAGATLAEKAAMTAREFTYFARKLSLP